MKWRKLGKIFNPAQHGLPSHCEGFAQSPQVLILRDRVRVYFSTRERDSTGKFLSHVAYVDFDKTFSQMLNVSDHTVIALGNLGCFDEHGIFPLNVLRKDDHLFGFIGGWNRRVSVSVDGSIGVCISRDQGRTFERLGEGPVLTCSLKEPFLVGDPFVQYYGDQYHMWYIFGTEWKQSRDSDQPERTYKIGHAISTDAINWTRPEEGAQLIESILGEDESQALPTVIKIGPRYHMYFCYRQSSDFRKNRSRGYRLGYAYSNDICHWERNDAAAGIDVSHGDWDSDMMCYPHLFEMDGQVYMMYNGNEFGRTGFGLAVLEQ
jgi:hypothetical protein